MKSRKFIVIGYENLEFYQNCLSRLSVDGYAFILHDMDTLQSGELKKPHVHIYLEFENARELHVIAKALEVEQNLVEKVQSTKGYIRYMVHADNPEKYQYDISQIVSNMDISKYFNDKAESLKVIRVLEIIEDAKSNGFAWSFVISECAKQNLYDVLRRASVLFLEVWRNK